MWFNAIIALFLMRESEVRIVNPGGKMMIILNNQFFRSCLFYLLCITGAYANVNNIFSPFTITVQPNTILPSVVALGSTVHAKYQITNNSPFFSVDAIVASIPEHTLIQSSGCGAQKLFTLAPHSSCTLTLTLSPSGLQPNDKIIGMLPGLEVCKLGKVSCTGVKLRDMLNVTVIAAPSLAYQTLMQDILINADLWGDTPAILSANYGFEGIEGVPGNETAVILAGGAWELITTSGATYAAYTSALTPSGVTTAFGYATNHADAMPICFTWPVLPSTVNPSDFRLTLNTGEVVTPRVASISPNYLYNKRSCVVIFGEFGNRLAPGSLGAIYPTKLDIVDNGTTLMLVGPQGPVSAVGLSKACGNPYQPGGGPMLIGAKLSMMSELGQNAPALFRTNIPNGGTALYGSNAQYRLRLYFSAGTSPDGVAAVLPTDYGTFFKVQVNSVDGSTWLTQTGVDYTFSEGTIQVVGLADLGKAGTPLNDAYVADRDNYIDIILKGDESAIRKITTVEVPASGDYQLLYNPGGPGNNPTPHVQYTYPGPTSQIAVTLALEDPLTVNYPGISAQAALDTSLTSVLNTPG